MLPMGPSYDNSTLYYKKDATGDCEKKKSFREMMGDKKIISKCDIPFMKFSCEGGG